MARMAKERKATIELVEAESKDHGAVIGILLRDAQMVEEKGRLIPVNYMCPELATEIGLALIQLATKVMLESECDCGDCDCDGECGCEDEDEDDD